MEQLNKALLKLTEDEYKIIKAIFYDKESMRNYARRNSILYSTVQQRNKKILQKLKKFMKN